MTKPALTAAVLTAVAMAALALATPAHAWWRGGMYFGFPGFLPYYYPPPVVYAPSYPYPYPYPSPYPYSYPPPAYYPPPGMAAPQQAGPACHAGAVICPLTRPAAIAAPCTCPTKFGPISGRVG